MQTKHLGPAITIGLLLCVSHAWADGWHNASLSTASLDEWMADVKRAIPDIDTRLNINALKAGQGGSDLKRAVEKARANAGSQDTQAASSTAGSAKRKGGRLDTRFTPQQQALLSRKAADCLEILAYMDPMNIFPAEFPRFPMKRIPEYRDTAKRMLRAMGPAGGSAVVGQIRAHLTGAFKGQSDISPDKDYQKDLLEVLRDAIENGNVTQQDLDSLAQAASGPKPDEVAAFGRKVKEVLATAGTLETLLNWIQESRDTVQKQTWASRALKRVESAEQDEMLNALKHPAVTDRLRGAIAKRLAGSLSEAGIVELLRLLETNGGPELEGLITGELARRSPKFADVQSSIGQLWEMAQSDKVVVSRQATAQLANAFERAPITQCVLWLAKGDAGLNEVIWKSLEVRIQRADEDRRSEYVQRGVALLADTQSSEAIREQALEFLRRLKDRRAAKGIVDALLTLPNKLWPKAGAVLQELTGQDFGPKAGDKFVDVTLAAKRWRTWLQQ